MSNKPQHIHQARSLVREMHSGVLATVSLSVKGFPFGSVTPYLMTENGDLVIYASDIAQHSRNMKADKHVSVCIHDGRQLDSQSNARVTLLAFAEVDGADEALQAQYLTLFPQANKYVQTHDFRFYLLRTQRVRYIGGFGEIYWFDQEEWSGHTHAMASQAQGVIQHMNEDHSDALIDILQYYADISPLSDSVKMLSCFAEGFHVDVDSTTVFIPFLNGISSDYDVRKAMVDLTKISRKELSVA